MSRVLVWVSRRVAKTKLNIFNWVDLHRGGIGHREHIRHFDFSANKFKNKTKVNVLRGATIHSDQYVLSLGETLDYKLDKSFCHRLYVTRVWRYTVCVGARVFVCAVLYAGRELWSAVWEYRTDWYAVK